MPGFRIPSPAPLALTAALGFPMSGIRATGLDKVLESLEVAFDTARNHAQRIVRVFHGTLRFIIHFQGHSRAMRFLGKKVKVRALQDVVLRQANPLYGRSAHKFRRPFFRFAADVRHPMEMPIIQLTDLFHAFHEFREGFKSRPLIVNTADGSFHFDRFFNAFP